MAPPQHQRQALYSLTSLQLGDMQSYVSKLYIYAGKKKLVFFIDNGPWSTERSRRSKPVEFWQLMVNQSRISPFANRSSRCALIDGGNSEELVSHTANSPTMRSKRRLFHKEQSRLAKLVRDLFQIQLRSVVRMQELSHLLYGCVTFELEWKNVRGINYLNELQTDTCVALEVKLLVKRDFCGFKEALAFYGIERQDVRLRNADTMWTPATLKRDSESNVSSAHSELYDAMMLSDGFFSESNDCNVAQNHKDDECSLSNSELELFDAVSQLGEAATSDIDGCTNESVVRTSSSLKGELDADGSDEFLDTYQCSCKPEKATKDRSQANCLCPASSIEEGVESERATTPNSPHSSDDFSDDTNSSCSLKDDGDDEEEALLVYTDTLLLFRFCDPILPLELKQIITADQRLLKMLESGLPSWVIFLQSYPVVRKLYRPWMRPLAKTMYILVSIITVIIGFYDLYKNVPVLKATAARICGPFFEWIEAWEMVSRVKYLGTVLFLQNWEKAFRWLLLVFSTLRKLSNLILQPMVEPLGEFLELVWPAWNIILDSVWGITSLLWMICTSVSEYTNFILQILVLPFIWLLTAIWSLVTWVICPTVYAFWGLIILPIRVIMLLVDYVVAVMFNFYKAIQSFWVMVSSFYQLLSVAGPQAERTANSSASTLRLLWNDIFSQVFRAVRSIVNVFVAFFTTCNRHRLSIYNHMEAFVLELRGLMKSVPSRVSNTSHQGGLADELNKRSSRVAAGGQMPRHKGRKRGLLTDKSS